MNENLNQSSNVPSVRREYYITNRSFKYCAPHLYNTLPKTIRQLDNIEIFKKKLKTYIFSETFDFETKTIRHSFAT